MNRSKIFYNLIGIPILALLILLTFSTKSEASIKDFVSMINGETGNILEQASIKRWRMADKTKNEDIFYRYDSKENI